jgi:pimeloyl-ACP methyl ester carboxylesterase
VVPTVGGLLLRLPAVRRAKLTATRDAQAAARFSGGDLSRMSAEMAALLDEERREVFAQPWRLDCVATAWTSAVMAMYVRRRSVEEAIDRVAAPTLLLWGAQDPLIGRTVIDGLIARRPDWDRRVIHGAGHVLPIEVPDHYVEVVTSWYTAPTPNRS